MIIKENVIVFARPDQRGSEAGRADSVLCTRTLSTEKSSGHGAWLSVCHVSGGCLGKSIDLMQIWQLLININ